MPLAVRTAGNSPDAAGALRALRIAGVDGAVGRDGEIVRLVELAEWLGLLGSKYVPGVGLPGSKTCNLCCLKSATYIRPARSKRAPLPIPPLGSLANCTDLVVPGLSLPMTSPVPVVDFQVHDEERAGSVDGGSFDLLGVLAGVCQSATDEQCRRHDRLLSGRSIFALCNEKLQ